jgi:hypothetical protein
MICNQAEMEFQRDDVEKEIDKDVEKLLSIPVGLKIETCGF